MHKVRYGGRPVYFSDLVVRAEAPFCSFADLRDATWAYNEPASFSGYIAMHAYLAANGYSHSYFGAMHQTGSHQRSLEAVIAGEADLTAIDSIVLEQALALEPALAGQIRTILTIGPNPVPPLVVARHVAPDIVASLGAAQLAADCWRLLRFRTLLRSTITTMSRFASRSHHQAVYSWCHKFYVVQAV